MHKIPLDFDEPEHCRGRISEDHFSFDLQQLDTSIILNAKLFEGCVAYIATEIGLVKWEFIMEANNHSLLQIPNEK